MLLRRHSSIQPAAPPIDAEPVRLKAPRRSAMGSVIGHTGFNVARYHITHVFGALFPLLAGMLMFGWRAVASVIIVLITTLLSGLLWRKIGRRGHPLRPAELLWLGVVIALMLPPTLLHLTLSSNWPLLPAAGLLITMVCWGLGAVGNGRFHPAVVVFLLLSLLYGPLLSPHLVLQKNRLLLGDLLAAPALAEVRAPQFTWRNRQIVPGYDAIRCQSAADSLISFTRSASSPDGSSVSLETLLRDHLPPMEDLVLGAVPGGIGVCSSVAVIIGGLFLLYRGLIDYRIPLLVTSCAWITMLILPFPLAGAALWQWVPAHTGSVGWAMGTTLVNYELLASPLLFTAFFLAGSPTVRPLTRRGRVLYAIMVGVFSAIGQFYLSVSLGSYLALMLVGLFSPLADRFLASKPLV